MEFIQKDYQQSFWLPLIPLDHCSSTHCPLTPGINAPNLTLFAFLTFAILITLKISTWTFAWLTPSHHSHHLATATFSGGVSDQHSNIACLSHSLSFSMHLSLSGYLLLYISIFSYVFHCWSPHQNISFTSLVHYCISVSRKVLNIYKFIWITILSPSRS